MQKSSTTTFYFHRQKNDRINFLYYLWYCLTFYYSYYLKGYIYMQGIFVKGLKRFVKDSWVGMGEKFLNPPGINSKETVF